MKAVILAGGQGARLAPYTTVFPKPLMPVGETPILETIIKQLKVYGFTEVILAVGYLSELIKAYFSDESRFGIKISYSKEENPLGTAGPLALIDGLTKTFLVMNGDVLTLLSYQKLLDFHKKNRGIATIAVNQRSLKVDYGIIQVDKANFIKEYIEKPELSYLVSMGIYLFEPECLGYIEKGQKLDLPNLVEKLLLAGEKVAGYISDDYWLDIGRHDDYDRAQEEFSKLKDKFLNVR